MSLEIVLGPMFSGKSSYAISYVRRIKSINKGVIAIKPSIDNRYTHDEVLITHDREQIPCIMWNTDVVLEPTRHMFQTDYIVIEEAQFFKGLQNFVKYMLVAKNKHIVLVGLDGDANQNSFGEILECIPYASKITKLNSLCSICRDGSLAPFTRKIHDNTSNSQIDVGGSDKYVAVCLKHLRDN
jgi:thymidine kinase